VDLDNLGSDFQNASFVWKCTIHHGTGRKKAIKANPATERVVDLLKPFVGFTAFERDIKKKILRKLPKDSLAFQKAYCIRSESGPETILLRIKSIIDEHFPQNEFQNVFTENSRNGIPLNKTRIPIRVVAALLAVKMLTESIG
jgi:hypothetical protein